MLGFPRDPVVGLYLSGWQDVSADVRQEPGISITHGRKDEAPRTAPARCTFTLDDGPDHGDGNYHPNNPAGDYYGILGRNTPVRVALRLGTDDFTRTAASDWGTSAELGAWSSFQSAGTVAHDVTGGVGRHSITSTSAFIADYVDDVSVRNVDVTASVLVTGVADVTGGSIEPANLLVRGQSTTDYYMLRVTVSTAEVVTVSIMQGSSTVLAGAVTVSGLTYSGQTLRARFQADDATLRGKVWAASAAEPQDWHVDYTAEDPLGAGWVGVRSGVSSGNSNTKPIRFLYDDVDVTLPRFYGEVAKLTPETTIDHGDRVTRVECASIRRRMIQGTRVLDAAPRRYLTGGGTIPTTVVDYWPLDEQVNDPLVGQNLANFGGTTSAYLWRVTNGSIKWGVDTGLLAFSRCVEMGNEGNLFCQTNPNKFPSTSWGVSFMYRKNTDHDAWAILELSDGSQVQINMRASGEINVASPDSLVTVFNIPEATSSTDSEWHKLAYSVAESGGNSIHRIAIDGESPAAYQNTEAGTMGSPVWMILFSLENMTAQYAQVMFFQDAITNGSPPVYDVIHNTIYEGQSGETAGDRFVRLCDEEGVAYTVVGDLDVTAEVGPQREDTLINLLRECVAIDQGSEYDPRGAGALGMRTNRSVVVADVVATVDYAGGQVAPVFGPTDDDQATLNDVTATRAGEGGSWRVERTTGPLNTQDPGTAVDAVGRYDASVTVNVPTDADLGDQAGWRVHVGTIAEPRYPTVVVNLAAPDVRDDAALTHALLDLGVDDRLTVTNAQDARIYDDVRQVVRGYVERIGTAYEHQITYQTTPASVYDGAVTDDGVGRTNGLNSTLNSSFVAGTGTSMSVATATPRVDYPLWSTSAGTFNVRVGGVVLEVTAVSGTTSPQTFTVTQATVNGINKTIAAGTKVELEHPVYLVP